MTVTLPVRVELERKGSTSSGAILTGDEGVVEALVSITGVIDNVGDLIVPGTYRRTLAERRPKGIFSHDTKVWTARTEAIEELMPGDPRLPKMTKDGKPWPREAGALYVKCRFNLASDDGRNAYETVRFFSETDECEWSIGYTVPKGGAKSRGGIRYITDLDLWEYSPVLFGAASMSATLSVKANQPTDAPDTDTDTDDDGGGGGVGDEWDDLLAIDDTPAGDVVGVDKGAMLALTVPPDAAAELAVPDGLAPDDLHVTLVYLGKNIPAEEWERAVDVARQVAADQGPLSGQLGGIGAFPDSGDGVPQFVPVDVPGLEVLRQRIAAALDAAGIEYVASHGYTPHVTLKYADASEPLPDPVAPIPIVFDGLVAAVDDVPMPIPFGHGIGAGPGSEAGAGDMPQDLPDAAAEVKQAGGWETKAGRVLSDANAKRLRTALHILREVLAAAGMPVDHDKTEIPVQDEENPPPPPSIMPDSTAPSAMPNELKTGLVLTAEEIQAGLDIVAEVKAWQ
ncbi:2'-5' RNA ligase family protein [Nonomuraea fuscirosea]|uniref:2'-5' RNA ligase family protein n=1 Tax=Nonomuraea fuscirosea TaxID=1291556 RepID=UPI00371B9A4D